MIKKGIRKEIFMNIAKQYYVKLSVSSLAAIVMNEWIPAPHLNPGSELPTTLPPGSGWVQYPLASVASPVCGPAPGPPRRDQLGPPWQLNVGRTIYYLLLFLLLTSGFCGQWTHNYFSNIDNQCTNEIEDTLLTLWTLPIVVSVPLTTCLFQVFNS